MKEIIIYKSKTGFTKQYAMWISEETGIEAKSIKEIKLKSLRDYDRVIYGEYIMASTLRVYKKIRKFNPNIVYFAVGLSSYEEVNIEDIKAKSGIDGELFFLRGGVNFDKLSLIPRFLLKKVTGYKENHDFSNKEAVNNLVDYIKG